MGRADACRVSVRSKAKAPPASIVTAETLPRPPLLLE